MTQKYSETPKPLVEDAAVTPSGSFVAQDGHKAPKRRTRRMKLALALDALAREGIIGAHAYAPALRGLARMGLIVKPLFFWNPVLLFVFSLVMFTTIFVTTLVACLILGVMPRPLVAMVEAGPMVFLGMMAILSLVFTGYHAVKARGAGLPRWQEL